MAAIQRFEDVIAWQKARQLTRDLYMASGTARFERDFGLRDQIRRASVSIMANIAEGFERKGTGEFAHFLMIAKASCAEVRSHLYVALDVGYVDSTQFDDLSRQASEIGRILAGLHSSIVRVDPRFTAAAHRRSGQAASGPTSELGPRNSELS